MNTNENKPKNIPKIVSRLLAVVFTVVSVSSLFMGNIDVANTGYQNNDFMAGVSTTFNVNGSPYCFHLDTISPTDYYDPSTEYLEKVYNFTINDYDTDELINAGSYSVQHGFFDIRPHSEPGDYNVTIYPTIMQSSVEDKWNPSSCYFGWEFDNTQDIHDIDIVVRYYDFNSDTALHTYTFHDINTSPDGFTSTGEFDIFAQFYRRMQETGREPFEFHIDGIENPVYGFVVDSISIDFEWTDEQGSIYYYVGNEGYPTYFNNEQYSLVHKALYNSLFRAGANSVGGVDHAMDTLFAPIESFLNIDLFGTFGIGELLLVAVAILFFGLFLKVFVGG